MATVGTMVVNLVARTEAFVKGMDASKRRIRMLEKATKKTMATVRRYGMIAGAAAVGGLTLLIKRSFDVMDSTRKLADRLGTSTEFLIAYGHQAKKAGTSQEEFGRSMEMFNRRIGEIRQGSGEAQRGIKKLGIATEDIISMTPEEAFNRVAEGIRGLGTQAEKAVTAYQFFGRSGSKMLNLLETNLSGAYEESKKLGHLFSREMASRIEYANNKIDDMKEAFQGVANSVAIALSPMIEVIAEQVADLASGEHSVERIETAVRSMANALTYVHDAWLLIKGVVEGVYGLTMRLYAISLVVPSELARLFGKGGWADILDGISSGLWEVGGEMFSDNAIKNIGKAREELERFFHKIDQRRSDYVARVPGVGDFEDDDIAEVGKALGPASAMEISRHVSVAGMSMGGIVDKQDTTNNLLQTQNQILREMQTKLVMN